MFSPPRPQMATAMPMKTSTRATSDHQRTLRRLARSTSGAITSTSPRISSCMKGMETPTKVKERGTVVSSRPEPMPDSRVQKMGWGILRPPSLT